MRLDDMRIRNLSSETQTSYVNHVARFARYIRRELRLMQARLAEQIGAAGKAVVYQWESGKRKPSSVLWKKIEQL